MEHSQSQREAFASFLKRAKAQYLRCLEPSLKCTGRPIRAHSVQNSRLLDLLAKNGHVIGLMTAFSPNEAPRIEFGPIGRNQATTFTGICSHHDNQIFAAIEKNELNFTDPEQLFLFAYRAAYRELHATMAAAAKLQSSYLERVEQGLDPEHSPSEAGLFATERMMISWITFKYKSLLDKAHAENNFKFLNHSLIILDVDQACLAACALFSVDRIQVRDDVLRIHLNILPIEKTKTVVLFSYLRSDTSYAHSFLDRILTSQGSYQRYELSRLILECCENFVLSPDYFDMWTDEKKMVVQKYFTSTLFDSDINFEHPDLYLF
jgi:hypothetical protein